MKKFISNLFQQNWLRKLTYVLLLSLPIVLFVFKFSIIQAHGIFRGEDWDYFAQSYEAARQSIMHYHQFPWWNPWMNGGQPLFANPQFGLFSIQTPLVLAFGTLAGLHYAMFVYFVLGFWGMYRLLLRIGSNGRFITVLLSYIWVFSGFASWHLGGGQLTFALYLLVPWAFLTILNIHKRFGWLWFGLVASLFILTAMHYLTFETLLICGVIALVQIIKLAPMQLKSLKAWRPVLAPYVWASVIILILCGVRLFYTFQFTHQYPRFEPVDPGTPISLFTAAITFRHPVDPASLASNSKTLVPYGWSEYANYFGLITLGLFAYLVVSRLEKLKRVRPREWFILGGIALAALITLGGFSRLSPFNILHHLPIFNQMRVPSRFICWFSLGIILFLAKLPKRPVIYALLIVSVMDVFLSTYPVINYAQRRYVQKQIYANAFEQQEFFQTKPDLGVLNIINLQNLRLLRATQENQGEVYGYEPILNIGEFYYLPGTKRCGINKGCHFVLTNNATVTYWSPLRIVLKRTGSGPIKLNMNPGKVWQVNGQQPFASYRILELQKDFEITNPSQDIVVNYHPTL